MGIANVIRVSVKGTLPGGEVWSINPVYQIGGVSTAEDISTDEAAAMATAVSAVAIPTQMRAALSSNTLVTSTRIEARRWNGDLAAIGEALRGTGVTGTGNNPHPFQTSVVISLRTAGVGASGRGRAYWPATGYAISATTLRPPTATNALLLADVKTFLTSVGAALNTVTDNDCILSVWSRLNGNTQPVTGLQIGDILDTQRRRRDQQIETYSSVAWP